MKIAFFYNTKTTWTLKDLEILKTEFDVTDYFIRSKNDAFKAMFDPGILKQDVFFFWFASFSFLPAFLLAKLLGKTVVTVAGGFDVAAVKEIGFGAFARGSISRLIRRMFFNGSHRVLCVSQSNEREATEIAGVAPEKISMIYHGFKDPGYPLKPWTERSDVIISIGQVTMENTMVKGHQAFCETAKLLPQYQFYLIGRSEQEAMDYLKTSQIPNLTITGFLSEEDLFNLLNDAKLYLQLSHHEGFGCSVVDAALMGNYPIVYDRYALPEVVEGAGSVVPFSNLEKVKEEIISKLQSKIDEVKLKDHYLTRFSFEKRKSQMLSEMKKLKY